MAKALNKYFISAPSIYRLHAHKFQVIRWFLSWMKQCIRLFRRRPANMTHKRHWSSIESLQDNVGLFFFLHGMARQNTVRKMAG